MLTFSCFSHLCEFVLGNNCQTRTAIRSYLTITTGHLVEQEISYVDMKPKEECVCKSFQKGKMYEENNPKLDRMTVVDF